MRLLTLFVTVVIGIYLTIMIANMGGYVDTIMRGEIRDRVTGSIVGNAAFVKMDPAVRQKLINERIAAEEERVGLNVPIAIRNFRYLSSALTLQLGRAINMTSDSGSKQVRLILLERLPATLIAHGNFATIPILFECVAGPESLAPLWKFLGQAGHHAFAHLGRTALVLWHLSSS